jgi:hypothetical protein
MPGVQRKIWWLKYHQIFRCRSTVLSAGLFITNYDIGSSERALIFLYKYDKTNVYKTGKSQFCGT